MCAGRREAHISNDLGHGEFLSFRQNNAGEAYDDEDPTPAFIVAYAIHFCDSSGEEARKGTAGGGSTVEKPHWKLRSVRWVPLADEVDCTWEEASSETALSVRNMHAKVEGS